MSKSQPLSPAARQQFHVALDTVLDELADDALPIIGVSIMLMDDEGKFIQAPGADGKPEAMRIGLFITSDTVLTRKLEGLRVDIAKRMGLLPLKTAAHVRDARTGRPMGLARVPGVDGASATEIEYMNPAGTTQEES